MFQRAIQSYYFKSKFDFNEIISITNYKNDKLFYIIGEMAQ